MTGPGTAVRRARRAVLVVGMAFTVAACGDAYDDDSPGTNPPAPATTVGAGTATTVAPGTEPDYGY